MSKTLTRYVHTDKNKVVLKECKVSLIKYLGPNKWLGLTGDDAHECIVSFGPFPECWPEIIG